MTLVDLMALVAGVGASYALVANFAVPTVNRTRLDLLVFTVLWFLEALSLAFSTVALVRVGTYQRMPTSAEWLGLLVGLLLLTNLRAFRIDDWIHSFRWAFQFLDPISYTGLHWIGAGLLSAGSLVGLGLVWLGRRSFPTWLKTILLALVALQGMAGPLWVVGFHGADWLTPAGGFGPGTASTLYRGACLLAANLPMGLLFGVPAIASLNERFSGRRWSWIEWAVLSISMLTGFIFMMTYRWEFRVFSLAWLAERLLVLAWFAVIAFLSRWILIRSRAGVRRWIGVPADQVSDPAEASPSRTL